MKIENSEIEKNSIINGDLLKILSTGKLSSFPEVSKTLAEKSKASLDLMSKVGKK